MGELIVNGIKWAALIAIGVAFFTAISTFLSFLAAIIVGNVVGEVFAIADAFLPFSLTAIFAGFNVAISSILAFMVARKVFSLTTIIIPK